MAVPRPPEAGKMASFVLEGDMASVESVEEEKEGLGEGRRRIWLGGKKRSSILTSTFDLSSFAD